MKILAILVKRKSVLYSDVYRTHSSDKPEGTELQSTDILHKEGESTEGGQLEGDNKQSHQNRCDTCHM